MATNPKPATTTPPVVTSRPMTNEEGAGCLLVGLLILIGFFGWVFYLDYAEGWKRRNIWEGYATRNPEVQIVSINQGQYGPSKWNASQIIVEIRGTKTGETLIIREKDDHVYFTHLPQPGQIWRTWITEGPPGSLSFCFNFRMEPVPTKQP